MSCPRLDLFQDHCRIVEHSQLEIAARSKDMPLPIGFQGMGDSWRKRYLAWKAIRKLPTSLSQYRAMTPDLNDCSLVPGCLLKHIPGLSGEASMAATTT